MRKYILLVALFLSMTSIAQTTFSLDWMLNSPDLDITILQGDTVVWTWQDAFSHTVTNKPGSQENFDSGTLTGVGESFSFTFTEVGINEYECQIHPGSMFGTVTIASSLGVDEKFIKNLQLYPNPTENEITIFSLYKLSSFILYDFAGKKILSGLADGNFSKVDTSNITAGVYFIVLTSEAGLQATKKIVKK